MPTSCWLKHLCSIRALVPVSFFLSFFLFLSFSLSLYFWLIPWNAKTSWVTLGILASFFLSLSHRWLRTTRFQSNKGPTLISGISKHYNDMLCFLNIIMMCYACCMLSRFSHFRLSETPRTAAHQAPLSTGFSRQEYWSGLPFPPLEW